MCRHLIREYRKSPAAFTTAPKAKLRFSREQIPGMWAATTLLRRMFATMVLDNFDPFDSWLPLNCHLGNKVGCALCHTSGAGIELS